MHSKWCLQYNNHWKKEDETIFLASVFWTFYVITAFFFNVEITWKELHKIKNALWDLIWTYCGCPWKKCIWMAKKKRKKKSGLLWIPDTFLIANLACFKRIDKTKKKKEKAYQHWRVEQRPDSPVVALSFAAFSSTIQF